MRENSDNLPFRNKPESSHDGGFEFEVSRFENDDRYVVKKLNKDMEGMLELGDEAKEMSTAEYARERYKKGYELLKQYLGDHLPKSHFVIGHSQDSEQEEIYIIQEAVDGVSLEEILGERYTGNDLMYALHDSFKSWPLDEEDVFSHGERLPDLSRRIDIPDFLKQLDNIVTQSLRMWEETLDAPPKSSPLSMTWNRKIRRKERGEGLFPEITNRRNLIFGKTVSNKNPKLYLVDNGVITVPSNIMTTDDSGISLGFRSGINDLLILPKLNKIIRGDFFQERGHSESSRDFLRKFTESKAGEYYDEIVSKHGDSDKSNK